MQWTWIVFIIAVIFCVYRGYRKGFLGALSQIIGLIGGYLVAFWYYDAAASWLQKNTLIEGVLAFVVGGVGLFFATSFLIDIIFALLQKFIFPKQRTGFAAWGGAVVGLFVGIFWGLLAVFTVSYAQDMLVLRDQNTQQAQSVNNQAETDVNVLESLAREMAGQVVTTVANAADMEPTVSKLGAALARNPQKVSNHIQQLSQSDSIKQLFNNPNNQSILAQGNADEIMSLPAFQSVMTDPNMRALAEESGLAADNSGEFEQELAGQMANAWQRVQGVKDNDRAQELLRDPELQQQLQSKNPAVLLTNQRFMELVDIILSEPPSAPDGGPPMPRHTANDINDELSEPSSVYRWRDDKGRLHFGDLPPERYEDSAVLISQ